MFQNYKELCFCLSFIYSYSELQAVTFMCIMGHSGQPLAELWQLYYITQVVPENCVKKERLALWQCRSAQRHILVL